MKPRSSPGARLGLSLGALVLVLGALEGMARLWFPAPLAPHPGDLRRGAFTRPGDHPVHTPGYAVTVHVNARGFVDREWAPRRPEVQRVVVLGDSFVQAAQVDLDQGFGRVLDETLGEGVEVLSLGVPGAGTGTALGLLDGEALGLDPDLVVLGFLVSNDVLNNHPLLDTKPDKPYFRLQGGALVPWPQADAGLGALSRSWLWTRSALVRGVGRRVLAGQEARAKVAAGGGMPIDLRVHDPAGGAVWEEAWRVTEALVGAMAERCAREGVGFGILLLPDAVQATETGHADAVGRWPALADWDVQAATHQAEHALSPVAPVVDLTPALQAADDGGEPLYLRQDGHWTARGHRVAAEAAAPAVRAWLGGG